MAHGSRGAFADAGAHTAGSYNVAILSFIGFHGCFRESQSDWYNSVCICVTVYMTISILYKGCK